MIQTQTLLKVSDNSGGKLARCLKVLKKGTNPKYAKVGDLVIVSIQSIRSRNKITSKVKKGDVVNAVVVKTLTPLKRITGLMTHFTQNAVVILTKQKKPLGTRVFGVVPKELRFKKFTKILTLAAGVV